MLVSGSLSPRIGDIPAYQERNMLGIDIGSSNITLLCAPSSDVSLGYATHRLRRLMIAKQRPINSQWRTAVIPTGRHERVKPERLYRRSEGCGGGKHERVQGEDCSQEIYFALPPPLSVSSIPRKLPEKANAKLLA